jgi:hypothetical protein
VSRLLVADEQARRGRAMSSIELAAPQNVELLRSLPSAQLYLFERAGDLAREVLDERVIEWTRDGWTQRRIAEELGCDHSSVSRRQARLGVKSSDPRGGPTLVRTAPKPVNGMVEDARIALPTNEIVVRRLAATAEVDEGRAYDIWRGAVDRYGPGATPEQVGEVAATLEGEAPSADAANVVKDAKRCATAVSKAVRKRDPRAARQALAIWRATVYRELDRIAREES